MDAINDFITNSNIVEILINGAINLAIAIVIFVVGKWIAKRAQNTLEKMLRKREVDEVLVDFLGTIAFALILVLPSLRLLINWVSRPLPSWLLLVQPASRLAWH